MSVPLFLFFFFWLSPETLKAPNHIRNGEDQKVKQLEPATEGLLL